MRKTQTARSFTCDLSEQDFGFVRLTNRCAWKKNEKKGNTEHGFVPLAVLKAMWPKCEETFAQSKESLGEYADVCLTQTPDGLTLLDYESEVILQFESKHWVKPEDALKMASEPAAEEVASLVPQVKPEYITRRFNAMLQRECPGATPREPTKEEADATAMATARSWAVERGDYQLLGLPSDVLDEIRDGRMDVYVMRKDRRDSDQHFKRTLDLGDLLDLAYGEGSTTGKKDFENRWRDQAKRALCLTATCATNAKCRWVCYYERWTEKKRGILVAFPKSLLNEALEIKFNWILRVFPTLLLKDMYPSPLYKERRSRGRSWKPRRTSGPPSRREATEPKGPDEATPDEPDEGESDEPDDPTPDPQQILGPEPHEEGDGDEEGEDD